MHGKIQAVIFCLFLSCGGATVAKADNRSVITTRHMAATPEEVLRAFVNDDDLKAWWQISRSLVEPVEDGVWSITWDDWGEDETQHAWSGVVTELSANKLVVANMVMNEPGMPLLGPMKLQIVVSPVDNGSSVTVIHSGYGYGGHWDEIYAAVVLGWQHVLADMQEWFVQDYEQP